MIETISKIYKWLETSGAKFGDTSKIKMSVDLVTEEYNEFLEANKENNEKEILDACVDLVWVFTNNLYFRGMPLELIQKMFNDVEESNFSKFCKTREEAETTCLYYEKGMHWDKQGVIIEADWEKVGDYYVVRRKQDDKILKSINYKKV